MKIKITDKILSVPPYISTQWDNVLHIYVKEGDLIVSLKDGTSVTISGLQADEIEQIFSAHVQFLEHYVTAKQPSREPWSKNFLIEQLFSSGLPLKIAVGAQELLTAALQHNPAYADLPPMPEEVTSKIATLAKMISPEEVLALPTAEPNCNCIYCQINRILRKAILPEEQPDHPLFDEAQEKVKEEDLSFEQWEVKLLSDKMYEVINKLDPHEHYTVYLGDPIGCTCGKPKCEHIVAVLRS